MPRVGERGPQPQETNKETFSMAKASFASGLPVWVRIADALTVALLLAALYVAVFGGVRIGTVFSMSSPWRALLGLAVVCGLRHYLVHTSPLHIRVWSGLRSTPSQLVKTAKRCGQTRPVRLAVRGGRWCLSTYAHATGMTVAASGLPVWVRIADALTVALLLAALYVAVFGGVRIGTMFSMSSPWRALLGLAVVCGLRHYLVHTSPLHIRVWSGLRSTPSQLVKTAAKRCGQTRPVRLAVRGGRWCLSTYAHATGMTVASALQVFAVTALAVAQPLFDVVAREPALFVARNTTSGQLFAFVAIISVALPLILVAIEAIFTRLHRVAGNVVHVLLMAVLGSVLLLPVLKRAGGMDTIPLLAVALMLAGGTAVACSRFNVGKMFLTALSPAALVIPAAFLVNPDVRGAVVATDLTTNAAPVEHAPPIVVVVFDEFPTNSLMNGDREIDGSRYPHFARLAGDATWYRNASTVSSQTVWAVPAMVTGQYPVEPHTVPTRRYYPNNLFTMLSESYQMTVFGRFLQLCPANACTYDLEVHDTLWDLTVDLAVVYAHVVAPDVLAARLPPIVGDWRSFAVRRMFREVDGERRRNDRGSEYERFLSTITSEPTSGRLYFLHTLTPHMPFEYAPSGTRYRAPDYQGHREGGEPLFVKSDPWLPLVLQQRHLLQVGFADRFIGNLIDHLQAQGIYDEALIVVTADHGSSFQHGQRRRARNDGNLGDILLVPLIVKFPQQVSGVVSDRVVETIDILPTIADVLSATVPYEVDGRSLLDIAGPERPHRTFIQRNAERVLIETYGRQLEDPGLEQKLKHFRSSLYGLGPHASLVGRSISTVDLLVGAAALATLENVSAFENVNIEAETLPLYVRGTIAGAPTEQVSLAIGVNGVIVATTVSYLEQGERVFASMIPEEALVSGANEVQVFVVDGVSDDAVLASAWMQESGA